MNIRAIPIRLTLGYAILLAVVGAALALSLSVERAKALTPITSTSLDLGSTGPNVTTLQTFLATSHSIYPEGLITGYFGPLTRAAVTQFQIAYNLPPVGRVGPLTSAQLNALISGGALTLDVDAPHIENVTVTTSSGQAVISWGTDESTSGKVHYSPSALQMFEVDKAKTEPQISGVVALDSTMSTTHSITLTGLNPHQVYYYSITSSDASQNFSVTAQGTFTTP